LSELITIIYFTKNGIKNFYVSYLMVHIPIKVSVCFCSPLNSVSIVSGSVAVVGLVACGVEILFYELRWEHISGDDAASYDNIGSV
jgi:uncharacterized membrane protein